MYTTLLEQLETAIRERNPILADRLQPGLLGTRMQKMFRRAKVEGIIEPVVSLFTWKNGSHLDPTLTIEQATPFPGSIYIFMDFELMLGHFRGFKEMADHNRIYVEVIGRYFPLFWDGCAGYLAVDLSPLSSSRVVLINAESENMVNAGYDSFEQFLNDAIHANRKNRALTCFK